MGSIKLSISPHNTPHIIHTVLSCTLAGVNKDVGIHVYIHTSEFCDYGNIVVDIDTIAVLLMRARLVSTIKIKSLYPLQPFQRYIIITIWCVYILSL